MNCRKAATPVAIVGVGEADVLKGVAKSSLEYTAEAVFHALADAGLEKQAVDGLLTTSPMTEHHHMYSTVVGEYLGLRTRYNASVQLGGATPHANLVQAAGLIQSGLCKTVLITDADSRASLMQGDKAQAMARQTSHQVQGQYEELYGPITPACYALAAQRHMYEYGTTHEQLAEIAVACRKHASLHPKARKREPITVDDVLASPPIASPLHLLDCCLVSDWGEALIVTSGERAQAIAAASGKKAVYLTGMGQSHFAHHMSQARELARFNIRDSADQAFDMAGVRRDEIDFMQVYDSFTITALLGIEGLGFCEYGEGGAFVSGGRIQLGGALPLNTNGGCLSYSGGHGHFLIEAVRQLRGEAGDRQVQNARIGVCQGTAAMLSSSITLILAS